MNMFCPSKSVEDDPAAPGANARAGFMTVEALEVGYGDTAVLKRLDLEVGKGEFVALLGASGCGKSTLLRTLAGFVDPRGGQIRVAGRDVTRLAPDRRGMALVFQSYALWPHMTVAQNIGYGLKLSGLGRSEISRRVGEMQALLGLDGLGDRKPTALSGGQRQRVALGRALAVHPDILLLDEPLSNLDARIRLTVRHEIMALQRRLGTTAIHVTHDREEAMVMADRIVILDQGRIAQVGTPEEVYNRPVSAFVAAFMGAENRFPLSLERTGENLRIRPDELCVGGWLPARDRAVAGGEVQARFRSEAVELLGADDLAPDRMSQSAGVTLRGYIEQVSYPGGQWRHVVSLASGSIVADAPRAFAVGEAVAVRVPAAGLFLFPPD